MLFPINFTLAQAQNLENIKREIQWELEEFEAQIQPETKRWTQPISDGDWCRSIMATTSFTPQKFFAISLEEMIEHLVPTELENVTISPPSTPCQLGFHT